VLEGLDLAEEYKLPRGIMQFIREHHGTGPIAYFLEKAKERDGVPANTAEFAYPGPSPRSIETAVVMLADGVEAAVRVLHDPTPQKIREVIDRIVRQRIDQGQLRESPITLTQLETVKEQVRALSGMYHSRIDYPAATGGITAEFGSTQPKTAASSTNHRRENLPQAAHGHRRNKSNRGEPAHERHLRRLGRRRAHAARVRPREGHRVGGAASRGRV
jgi:hypothetical protein